MHHFTRSVKALVLFAVFFVVPYFITSCRTQHTESAITESLTDDWVKGLPPPSLGGQVPYGTLTGVVIGVKTSSWGVIQPANGEAQFSELKDAFMDLFFEQARTNGPLFYSVAAIDARLVDGIAARIKPTSQRIRERALSEMADGYANVPADLRFQFFPQSKILERYVYAVDDQSMLYHSRLKLPDFGGYIITKDLKKIGPFMIPQDRGKLLKALKEAL